MSTPLTTADEPEPMSLEAWAALPSDALGELVDGRLVQEEAPDWIHEEVIAWLISALRPWVRARGGRIGGSGARIVVGEQRGRRPDVVVFLQSRPEPRGMITAVPDIVIEVISPTPADQRRDRVEKLAGRRGQDDHISLSSSGRRVSAPIPPADRSLARSRLAAVPARTRTPIAGHPFPTGSLENVAGCWTSAPSARGAGALGLKPIAVPLSRATSSNDLQQGAPARSYPLCDQTSHGQDGRQVWATARVTRPRVLPPDWRLDEVPGCPGLALDIDALWTVERRGQDDHISLSSSARRVSPPIPPADRSLARSHRAAVAARTRTSIARHPFPTGSLENVAGCCASAPGARGAPTSTHRSCCRRLAYSSVRRRRRRDPVGRSSRP
ncbi:MAG: Uma2 family endonuclease [Phycisphaeraceae bacterium]|nr:Uma2 family endonuclease [Phycisphaeraceae bacterium]